MQKSYRTINELTGQNFGFLTVEELLPERLDRYALYHCRCRCGKLVYANSKQLKRGTIYG